MNTEVLLALSELRPQDARFSNYGALASLPHFNPDHELDPVPAVLEWREALQQADGVIICSPEYAHGVPGVLKNALDWVVGTGEFMDKPVSLINASPGSQFVQPQLRETLTVMMANVVPDAVVTLSLLGKKRDARSIADDATVSAELQTALAALMTAIRG